MLFPLPIKTKMVMVAFGDVIIEIFEEHLFHSRDFFQIMGNISKVFWLATIQKEATKEVL
jgi:hypothetical protein